MIESLRICLGSLWAKKSITSREDVIRRVGLHGRLELLYGQKVMLIPRCVGCAARTPPNLQFLLGLRVPCLHLVPSTRSWTRAVLILRPEHSSGVPESLIGGSHPLWVALDVR